MGGEADNSLPSSECSTTSTRPICLHSMDKDNFTLSSSYLSSYFSPTRHLNLLCATVSYTYVHSPSPGPPLYQYIMLQVRLTLLPWSCQQYVPLRRRCNSNKRHGIISWVGVMFLPFYFHTSVLIQFNVLHNFETQYLKICSTNLASIANYPKPYLLFSLPNYSLLFFSPPIAFPTIRSQK